MDNLFKCIAVASFIDDFYLDYPVFIKSGKNYVLYKPAHDALTHRDIVRLERAGTTHIYLRHGDMEVYNLDREQSIKGIIQSNKYTPVQKAVSLFSVSTSYVEEIYKNPKALSSDIDRCRTVIDSILTECLQDPRAFERIAKIIEHSGYEYAHAIHVTTLSLALTHLLHDIERDEMIDLGTGAMLHDIGKIFIPESIIDKPGPLDRREYDIMKDHVLFGYDYLKSTISEEDILHIVRDHHERLDGRGYPNGLEGEEIGRNSRIVSAADVYCALVSDRSYRKGYTFEQAISIMKTEFAGKALAREIVEALETYLT